MSALKTLASALARSRTDRLELGDPRSVRAKQLLFAGTAVVLAMVFIPVIAIQMSSWTGFRPTVPITRSDWKFAPSPREAEPCGEVAGPGCLAHPENPSLFGSRLTREDPDHAQRTRNLRGREFWLGTTLGQDQMTEARRHHANTFIIGWINGSYRIWVDGDYLMGGTGRTEYEPIVISFPMARLSSDRPIRIAIRIYHDVQAATPDVFNDSTGGEGFVTHEQANTYRALLSFWGTTRPFSFFLAYLIMSLLFFQLWHNSRKEPEYFYLALHLAFCAFYQARFIDTLDLAGNVPLFYALGAMLEALKAVSAMYLGFSFARLRRSLFSTSLPVALGLALLVPLLPLDGVGFQALYKGLRSWLAPLLYGLGGAACLVQAAHLQTLRREGSYHPVRIRRLVVFGGGLLLSAAFYAYYATLYHRASTVTLAGLWMGIEQVLVALTLGFVAVREYRHNALLADRTPVSEYHQHSDKVSCVRGVLLVVDLKCSEPFYRHRAEHGENANLVAVWRSHIYTSASRHGGIVIHKKGDEVAVLFDSARREHPEADALRAVIDMTRASRQLEEQLTSQHLMPHDAEGFHFRAALASAALRPIWEELGPTREPAWEEAGEPTFELVGRLFKLERKVPGNRRTTLLLAPEALAKAATAHAPETGARLATEQDGSVTVFRPEAA